MAHRVRHSKAGGRTLVIGSLGAVSFPQEAQHQQPCSSPSSESSGSTSPVSEQGEACEVCGKYDDAGRMLLCDGCDRGFHTFCIGLKSVPTTEEWFCSSCALSTRASSSSSSAATTSATSQAATTLPSSETNSGASPSKNAKLSGLLRKLKQRSPMLQASAPPTAVSTLPPLELDSAANAVPASRPAMRASQEPQMTTSSVAGGDDSDGESLRTSPTSAGQDSALTMGSQRTALSLFDSQAMAPAPEQQPAAARMMAPVQVSVSKVAPSPPRPRSAAKAAMLIRGSPNPKHTSTRTSPGIRRTLPSPLRPKAHGTTKPLTMTSSKAALLPAPRYLSPAKGVSYARSFAKASSGAGRAPAVSQQHQNTKQQQQQQREEEQPQTRHAHPASSTFAAAAAAGARPESGNDGNAGASTAAAAAAAMGMGTGMGAAPLSSTPFSSPTPSAVTMARTVAVAKAKPSPSLSSTMRSPGQRLLASSSSSGDDDDDASAAKRKRPKYTRVLSSPDPKRRREAPRTAHQEEVEEDRKAEANLLAETASNRTLFG